MHHPSSEESIGETVERWQEIPAAELSGKYGHQRIQVALSHQRNQLIEPFEMGRANPFRIGLEERRYQQNAR
jgi:hypothetical protein